MIGTVRRMITCHWSARRIGRYLDADPAAPLTPAEVRRLEEHLAVCEKCSRVTVEHKALRRALHRWSQQHLPDEQSVARMHAVLDRLTRDGTR
ncbi:zf-HC2 domain-containing protein [Nocardioides coralli]|uniref:zf-HC2 domain-containing protein n=1 Tax=Nocardioides coralli TaxID=2872154 RepID=UPI001CA42B4A|nr:zf-HC2 domain-containing protein [Nocardioides coralli]QZY30126.1 zf-HC2 domain-containing protein [Nocardioides coralli]